jgi:hypothetical protein
MQVVARIAAAFRVSLPPNILFEWSTLAKLAEAVERARSIEPDETIRPAQRGRETPLSFAQQRLWVMARIEEPSESFNTERAFRLEGSLDTTALDKALIAIAARHDNLRGSFRMTADGAVETIAPECPGVLSLVDLRHLSQSRSKAALDTSLLAAHNRPFDLARGPLWAVCAIRLAGNKYVLHLAMHHIVSDDWSYQVLLRELSVLYSACLAGREDPLPALPVQYADYALWQRRWLTGERLEKQLAYWQDHLRGAPPLLKLPLDRPRQSGGKLHADMVRLHFDREITARLRRLSRESETTLFVTLLAAYAVLLSQYGNREDIVIGAALANRYPVETEALIGFFVNTLALRLQWRQGDSFRAIQACAHRAAINGFAHPDVPFDRVVQALDPDRSAPYSPVFQTLFVLQNVSRQELVLPGLTVAPMDLARPSAGSTFDLSLTLTETGGELRGALEFNSALFDIATIERMAAQFQAVLAGILQDPDAPPPRLGQFESPHREKSYAISGAQ